MSNVITTAGLDFMSSPTKPAVSRRKEILRAARATLRNPQSSDDEYEDALDTIAELSSFKED